MSTSETAPTSNGHHLAQPEVEGSIASNDRSTTTGGGETSNARSTSSLKQKITYVYIKDKTHGWIPAELIHRNSDGTSATVICKPPQPSVRINEDSYNDNGKKFDPQDVFLTSTLSVCSSHDDDGYDDRNLSLPPPQPQRLEIVIDNAKLSHLNNDSPTVASSNRSVSSLTATQASIDDHAHEYNAVITIPLQSYEPTGLPLQCVDEHGVLQPQADMRDLPYLHEPSILYNLKARYEGMDGLPYTRTGDILVAINPYRWINGLYAERTRLKYAEHLVWKANPTALSEIPPHLYETSSLAFKGLSVEGKDQSILVSGESGAGKTVSVKILMSHLATFHELKKAYISRKFGDENSDDENNSDRMTKYGPLGNFFNWVASSFIGQSLFSDKTSNVSRHDSTDENPEMDVEMQGALDDDEPEEMQQTNLIVQRVLDSNPLLEAFGNAKTERNDNSSRFSKYVKLQFHVEYLGRATPTCNIAGSLCDTYLLEKSRVVHHEVDKEERTFHIFYQLLAAPESYKKKLWPGLVGKDTSSFKYVGYSSTKTIEGLTDRQRWRKTISALRTVGVKGEKLNTLFHAICVVLQLGNLTFGANPSNEDGSFISNQKELEDLSDLLGIPSDKISHALTFKTVTAVHDSYEVPLSASVAKDTCDAFAKEIYSKVFDWLVSAINDATCATKNYEKAKEVSHYRHIGILDIFGFECFEKNHFEQLLINHANERLQKMFTENVFSSVQAEYQSEGITLEAVDYIDNKEVLNFLEGKMGLTALLNEECIRPRGSDSGFVNKIYSSNSSPSSKSILMFHKRYHLSKTMFGIRHYAGPVDYDAKNFVVKNMDTLPSNIIELGLKSSNDIIHSSMVSQRGEKPKRKGSLVATTLWTKFQHQLNSLFGQLSQTRTWYVRCINPNRTKEAGMVDMKYTLTQLRYVGILSALRMSRAAYPNRLTFSFTLDRFWFLAKHEFLQSMGISAHDKAKRDYNFWKMLRGNKVDEKRDVEVLLNHLLKSHEFLSADGKVIKPFVLGKTRIYFRAGALEFLESERAKSYDRCATTIQAVIRGKSARALYSDLRLNPPTREVARHSSSWALNPAKNSIFTSLFHFPFLIFQFIVGFFRGS